MDILPFSALLLISMYGPLSNDCIPGPIVPLLSFSTDQEAVDKANSSHYGLGGSIWSSNLDRANELALKIQAGTVWVNTHTDLDPRFPFGGHKHSGIGIENGLSGLKSWCNSQTLHLRK